LRRSRPIFDLPCRPSDAGRLTSVGAAHVMRVNKNQKTQTTIFQGGFDAGA
jgi:hypothetical protein